MAQGNRILQFDILRAIAILLVLFHHIPANYISAMGDTRWPELFWIFIRGGWCGVDLFFVLSGFLVSGIYYREYIKTGNISVGNFLIRRGFKIYPSFYFFILASVLISWITNLRFNSKEFLGEVVFIQNYFDRMWSPTWSLAVEEHFYILLTIFFMIFSIFRKKDLFKYLPHLFIVIAVFSFIFRVIVNIKSPQFNFAQQYQPTHLRIDSLMFGVLIAYYHYFKPSKLKFVEKRKYLIILICCIMLLPYFLIGREAFDKYHFPSLIATIGLTHLYLTFGLLLITSWHIPIKLNLFTKILSHIGKNSYAIYLWHAPVVYFIEQQKPNIWLIPVYILGSILLGYIITALIENPFLRLREKIFPSKSGLMKSKQPS